MKYTGGPKASCKRYYAKNKETIIANSTKYQRANKEKLRPAWLRASKKYRATPKGVYRVFKQNASKKYMEVMPQEDFILWYKKQELVCIYCGIPEEVSLLKQGLRLTIDRMNNDVGYLVSNVALACNDCNSVKRDILNVEDMKIVGKMVMRKRWLND